MFAPSQNPPASCAHRGQAFDSTGPPSACNRSYAVSGGQTSSPQPDRDQHRAGDLRSEVETVVVVERGAHLFPRSGYMRKYSFISS